MREKRILRLLWRYQTWDRGFTLLEVLLAIVIGVIVLTVLYGSFFQIIKAKDSAENAVELYHQASIVFSKMTEDLQSAFIRGKVYSQSKNYPYPSFTGKKEGGRSYLDFVSISGDPGINSVRSDQVEISYYLEPVPDTDLFLLIRGENARIGAQTTHNTGYAISERVVDFDVAYASDNLEVLAEEWDSSQAGFLPRAVEVTLVLRTKTEEDVTFTSLILIPVTE